MTKEEEERKERERGRCACKMEEEHGNSPWRRATDDQTKRRRRGKTIIFNEDFTTITPGVFHTWLQDTFDIMKHHNHRLSMHAIIYLYILANMNYEQFFFYQGCVGTHKENRHHHHDGKIKALKGIISLDFIGPICYSSGPSTR